MSALAATVIVQLNKDEHVWVCFEMARVQNAHAVKSVQSALSDLLTTSATHGTFSRPSTKRGLILIGLELNTNARESFEYCDQRVCQFIS